MASSGDHETRLDDDWVRSWWKELDQHATKQALLGYENDLARPITECEIHAHRDRTTQCVHTRGHQNLSWVYRVDGSVIWSACTYWVGTASGMAETYEIESDLTTGTCVAYSSTREQNVDCRNWWERKRGGCRKRPWRGHRDRRKIETTRLPVLRQETKSMWSTKLKRRTNAMRLLRSRATLIPRRKTKRFLRNVIRQLVWNKWQSQQRSRNSSRRVFWWSWRARWPRTSQRESSSAAWRGTSRRNATCRAACDAAARAGTSPLRERSQTSIPTCPSSVSKSSTSPMTLPMHRLLQWSNTFLQSPMSLQQQRQWTSMQRPHFSSAIKNVVASSCERGLPIWSPHAKLSSVWLRWDTERKFSSSGSTQHVIIGEEEWAFGFRDVSDGKEINFECAIASPMSCCQETRPCSNDFWVHNEGTGGVTTISRCCSTREKVPYESSLVFWIEVCERNILCEFLCLHDIAQRFLLRTTWDAVHVSSLSRSWDRRKF